MNIHNLIIIGSGPAGLTAGIYAGRANLHPIILEGTMPGGQLMGTSAVENWPGNISIMGPELMMNMKRQAEICGATILSRSLITTDFSSQPFKLTLDNNQEILAKSVIIATGTIPNKLNCPGEQEYWGKGVTTCAVCDGAFYPNKEVVIVGGGDTAMEDAYFMLKYTQKITIVHILDKLTASHSMQQRILNNPAISIIYNSTVSEIHGDGDHITGITITNQQTGQKTTKSIDGLFLAIGNKPNTAMLGSQLELTPYGNIKVTNHTKTSIDGVFAAGDVSDPRYRQAITSAGAGCMAALDAEKYLAEHP